jgi:predicted PurR-regulated permease PerM
MNLARPITFWVVILLGAVAAVMLLHGILLPFVAGMALAYLLDPLATRLERFGCKRAFRFTFTAFTASRPIRVGRG